MTIRNVGQIVSEEWERCLRESPGPEMTHWVRLFSGMRGSYRDQLDQPRYNWHGEPLTRLQMVRYNLRRLGSIRLDPTRLR